jgi:hypothetical protein
MWYTTTILTGIHYGNGKHMADISLTDAVDAMRVSFSYLINTRSVVLTSPKVLVALLRLVRICNHLGQDFRRLLLPPDNWRNTRTPHRHLHCHKSRCVNWQLVLFCQHIPMQSR